MNAAAEMGNNFYSLKQVQGRGVKTGRDKSGERFFALLRMALVEGCHPESFGRAQDKLREGSDFEIQSLPPKINYYPKGDRVTGRGNQSGKNARRASPPVR
jgi:hypothetical protein